ncbi:MAG: SDR family NAD(P)-dependent oxidoreductase [Rhodococcus sp.]|nr:SDR family NAD(P)-dependent oxidoreductase [Rhodococcus sp. (in: high G+C Gram-positive bacteria)]
MERGGRIINIASLAGLNPAPGLASFAASKAALISFSQSLHYALRGNGVVVTCVCAGYTRTDLQRRAQVDASRLPEFIWAGPVLSHERHSPLVNVAARWWFPGG